MVREIDKLEIKSPSNLESFCGKRQQSLWCMGDPAILNHTLLGIISARQIDSDLALKSAQLVKRLALLADVSFVGGWHSPLEEEALRIVLAEGASITFCVSKSLDRFVPSSAIENRVNEGKALLLTHCSPKAKRITRNASMRRNKLIVGLAKVLLVLSAPNGSATLKLAKSALDQKKPVLTLEHPMNKELLVSRALPATIENVLAMLGRGL